MAKAGATLQYGADGIWYDYIDFPPGTVIAYIQDRRNHLSWRVKP